MKILLITDTAVRPYVEDCLESFADNSDTAPKLIECLTCIAPEALFAVNTFDAVDLVIIRPAACVGLNSNLTPAMQVDFINRLHELVIPVKILSDIEGDPDSVRRANYYGICCPRAYRADVKQLLDPDWVNETFELIGACKELRLAKLRLPQLEAEADESKVSGYPEKVPTRPSRSSAPLLRLVVDND